MEAKIKERKICALNTLRAARTLLRKPNAWVKRMWGACNGEPLVSGAAKGANQFCMIGSIEHVLAKDRHALGSSNPKHPSFEELDREFGHWRLAPDFNDSHGTDQSDVIDRFDRMIDRLELETGDKGHDGS